MSSLSHGRRWWIPSFPLLWWKGLVPLTPGWTGFVSIRRGRRWSQFSVPLSRWRRRWVERRSTWGFALSSPRGFRNGRGRWMTTTFVMPQLLDHRGDRLLLAGSLSRAPSLRCFLHSIFFTFRAGIRGFTCRGWRWRSRHFSAPFLISLFTRRQLLFLLLVYIFFDFTLRGINFGQIWKQGVSLSLFFFSLEPPVRKTTCVNRQTNNHSQTLVHNIAHSIHRPSSTKNKTNKITLDFHIATHNPLHNKSERKKATWKRSNFCCKCGRLYAL